MLFIKSIKPGKSTNVHLLNSALHLSNFIKFIKVIKTFTLFLSLASIIYLHGCAAAAVSGAGAGIAMVNDRRSAGTIVDDNANELKALKVCFENREIWKQSHISAISYNGSLLLVGQTPKESFKREVEEELKNIANVRKIHNELTVAKPTPISTRSMDTWITTQIKAKMFGKKDLNPSRVKVVTEDGVVYLMGLTTEEEEQKATEISRSTPGVEKVVQIFDRAHTSQAQAQPAVNSAPQQFESTQPQSEPAQNESSQNDIGS